MPVIFECELPNLDALFVSDPEPRTCDWQGRSALRLSGQGACLVLVPDLYISDGWIETDISSEGAAYAGIAFRVLDRLNYELAYAQPHTSGMWDALQYDPVFHGSNTWQLYHGPGAQQNVDVPLKDWFRLRIEFRDQSAVVRLGDQKPLIVRNLAHGQSSGLVGLWTYLPAYFSNLRIGDDPPVFSFDIQDEYMKSPGVGLVTEWFLDGFGVVKTESNGILNLNRYLPVTVKEVVVKQQIELIEAGKLTFNLGFSDELILQIDGEAIFHGENLYHDSPKWEERGYVSLNEQVSHSLKKGIHQLTAILKAAEYFGFGIVLGVEGADYRFLPANLYK